MFVMYSSVWLFWKLLEAYGQSKKNSTTDTTLGRPTIRPQRLSFLPIYLSVLSFSYWSTEKAICKLTNDQNTLSVTSGFVQIFKAVPLWLKYTNLAHSLCLSFSYDMLALFNIVS